MRYHTATIDGVRFDSGEQDPHAAAEDIARQWATSNRWYGRKIGERVRGYFGSPLHGIVAGFDAFDNNRVHILIDGEETPTSAVAEWINNEQADRDAVRVGKVFELTLVTEGKPSSAARWRTVAIASGLVGVDPAPKYATLEGSAA